MSKDLLIELRHRGLLEYGSVISGVLVRELLGLTYPETGTKAQFDEIALAELGAIDYVRNILLGEGKYLAGAGGDYRILLPSENKRQVETYMRQADKKLRRAQKLSQNSPQLDTWKPDNTAARLLLKRAALRNHGAEAATTVR